MFLKDKFMDNRKILASLNEIADKLDNHGYEKLANDVTNVMIKIAQDENTNLLNSVPRGNYMPSMPSIPNPFAGIQNITNMLENFVNSNLAAIQRTVSQQINAAKKMGNTVDIKTAITNAVSAYKVLPPAVINKAVDLIMQKMK
jgi:hypothetical protein